MLEGKYYYRIFFRILARLPFKSVNYVAPCCVVSKLMINRKNETEKIGFRLGLSIGHHISIINISHDITNLIFIFIIFTQVLYSELLHHTMYLNRFTIQQLNRNCNMIWYFYEQSIGLIYTGFAEFFVSMQRLQFLRIKLNIVEQQQFKIIVIPTFWANKDVTSIKSA